MVVVDSSVLIHLSRINKLSLLNKFFKKIKITADVYGEIKVGIGASEIEKARKSWISIHDVSSDEADKLAELESIEKADASLIILSVGEKDVLLSNDYYLMLAAKSKGVECWWLTTFLLHCIEKKVVLKSEAKQVLYELVESGMRLSNEVYAAILKEIENM